ncbi:hypothetical protein [Nocardia tengchongensis]
MRGEWGEFGSDAAGIVAEQIGEFVGEGAARAQMSTVELAFVPVARAVVGDSESAQIGVRSAVCTPGRTRSTPQPGQRPRILNAWSWQVRQTFPSGQVAPKNPWRPHRAQGFLNQRSNCSSVQ